jgi:hypothetical protein
VVRRCVLSRNLVNEEALAYGGLLPAGGLCDGLITGPEESYQLWCVVVCDLETS